MKPYFETELNKLYCGDCFNILPSISKNSIDLIITDPPYGYSFMGKDWDKIVVKIKIWKECLRVLKPGAFCFVMSAPRQDVLQHVIYNLSQAGFETGFTSIYWTYASGFPKAGNIGKMVDKRLGAERKIIGKKQYASPAGNNDNFGVGNQIKNEHKRDITIPTTKEAEELEGSYAGFQPKPAVEIIIVAMKPLSEKTYVDQAMKNGKGITWLDDCRIPFTSEKDYQSALLAHREADTAYKQDGRKTVKPSGGNASIPQGRFPANLLVSDDVLNDNKNRSAGEYKGEGSKSGGVWHKSTGKPAGKEYGDSGSFSRYFDLDKWAKKTFPFLIVPKASKSEKNKGLEEFEKKQAKGGGGGIGDYLDDVNSASGKYGSEKAPTKNIHPTVKPIKLMSYLVTLGSRPNDIVLDPFMGSGTTGISARILGRKFIGIEKEKEYIKIAKARIEDEIQQGKFDL